MLGSARKLLTSSNLRAANYVQVPRGLRESILDECGKAGIVVDVSDQREKGRPIRVSFKGDLRTQQDLAAQRLLQHSDGVLQGSNSL